MHPKLASPTKYNHLLISHTAWWRTAVIFTAA
jgi:hypothetical protein